MNEYFKSISRGLQEAIEYSEGKDIGARIFMPSAVDVKQLRLNIGLTQKEFASTFGISLGTLRHWERGDRIPQGPALILLNLVQKAPQTILDVMNRL